MSNDEEERKKQFAILKQYIIRVQESVKRDMPSASEEEKTQETGRRMSKNLDSSRESVKVGLVETMASILRGKVLRRDENQSDRDYSGGSFYFEKSKALFLFEDGTFRYEEKTFSSVSGGGCLCRRKATELATEPGR